MKQRVAPPDQVLTRLAQLANLNAAHNYGRTFSTDSLRVFLGNCLTYHVFVEACEVIGCVSVRQDGELGAVIDPQNTVRAFRLMTDYVGTLNIPLWSRVQTSNVSVWKRLTRLGFKVVSKNSTDTVLRREA